MSKEQGKVFDVKVFGRLMEFAKKYRMQLFFTLFTVILLSFLTILRPLFLKYIIGNYITLKDADGLLNIILIMLSVLLLETVTRLFFIYSAHRLGFTIIKDIRMKLYNHMLSFKMSY